MHVTVEVFGPLRKYLPDERRTTELDVEEGTSVIGLLALLGIDVNEPWNASLNGTLASASDTLTEGSVVLFFPPIGGGESLRANPVKE
ncbi:MAG: MoaD/ThiS family protein [Chloroflexi bacterium]|nr:MoaD/ThiS family protein [Chloroflexota bacterium]